MKVTSMKIFLKMKDSCLRDLGQRRQMNIPQLPRWQLWTTQVRSDVKIRQTYDESQINLWQSTLNWCQHWQIVWQVTKLVRLQHVSDQYGLISGFEQQSSKPITPVHNPNLGYQYEISHPQTQTSSGGFSGGDRGHVSVSDHDNGEPIIRDNVENFQTFVTSDFFP